MNQHKLSRVCIVAEKSIVGRGTAAAIFTALLCLPAISQAEIEHAFPSDPNPTPTTLQMASRLAQAPAYNVSQSKENLITPSPSGLRMTYESLN